MNSEPKPQKPLSARIAERLKDQIDSLGMGNLPTGVVPSLLSDSEAVAEKAAFAYIDALTNGRVVKAIRDVFCPKQKATSDAKASVSRAGSGAQPLAVTAK